MKRKPFRLQRGHWYTLCAKCLEAVKAYHKDGGECDYEGRYPCNRCGEAAGFEFYPFLRINLTRFKECE